MLDWLQNNDVGQYVNLAALIISAAAAASAGIAKLTATKKDDKVAGWLKKAESVVQFVGLQKPAVKKASGKSGGAASNRRVVDRRRK